MVVKKLRVCIDPRPLNASLVCSRHLQRHMGDIVGSVCSLVSVSRVKFFRNVFMHQELQGLRGVKCIADDVIIHGTCEADHDSNLDGFMCRCQQKGIKPSAEKLEYKIDR